MKFFGLVICFAIIGGAVFQIGPHLFNDVMSGLFVLGGALGFALLKDRTQHMAENFGVGAVYFGWLGALVGLIAIAGNAFGIWGNVAAMGPALAVSILPVFYGYAVKLVCMTIASAPEAG